MTYQVLARKWRPQDFSSVVGQGTTVTALRNALTENQIAQAYLFSGIRGVGKTSVARILAKALNCENRTGADPCNECVPCKEITRGSDLDVQEVDAATYSKVEQVRDLTEALKYGPSRDKYKVVIIDEIHRLSRQAFDALLKIVEEPPPHLVFVFATTEAEAVPATVLSRCQEFRFRRVPAGRLAEHLRMLAGEEKIEASDTALRLIARAGEGSVRDAVALLDQLAIHGSGTIEDEAAARLLGGVGAAFHHRMLAAILSGHGTEISSAVRELEDEGWDPRHAYAEFLSYCRDALHLTLGGEAGTVDLPADEGKALAELVSGVPYETFLRLLNHLLASENGVRRSEAAALAAEIAWLRAAELPKLTRIEELLAGAAPGAATRMRKAKGGPAAPESSGGAGKPAPEEPPQPSLLGGAASSRAAQAPRSAAPAAAPAGPAPARAKRARRESGAEATERPATETTPDSDTGGPAAAAGKRTSAGQSAAATSESAAARAAAAAADKRIAGQSGAGVESAAAPTAAAAATAASHTKDTATRTAGPSTTSKSAKARSAAAAPIAGSDNDAAAATAAKPAGASKSGTAPTATATAASASTGTASPPAPATPDPSGNGDRLQEFVDLVSRRKQPLAAHLIEARGMRFADGRLHIHTVPGDDWLENALRRNNNRQVLEECLRSVWGDEAGFRLLAGEPEEEPAESPAAAGTGTDDPALQHPAVQAALDIFGGTAHAVTKASTRGER